MPAQLGGPYSDWYRLLHGTAWTRRTSSDAPGVTTTPQRLWWPAAGSSRTPSSTSAWRERRRQLGTARKLILLRGGNELDFVVTYLAARSGRHPLILSSVEGAEPLIDRYAPDVVVTTISDDVEIERRSDRSAHDLHPDLALMMSTSGSTGAPKLVRLSNRNLDANARSIAEFQRLSSADRGITSLPLHYCYGLSVLNAHRRWAHRSC